MLRDSASNAHNIICRPVTAPPPLSALHTMHTVTMRLVLSDRTRDITVYFPPDVPGNPAVVVLHEAALKLHSASNPWERYSKI